MWDTSIIESTLRNCKLFFKTLYSEIETKTYQRTTFIGHNTYTLLFFHIISIEIKSC